MTTSRRTVVTLIVTAAFVAAAVAVSVWRFEVWHERGWMALNVQPAPRSAPPKKVRTNATFARLLLAGRVIYVIPHGPAARAGIRADDVVLTINGVPFTDHAALGRLDARAHRGDVLTYRLKRGDRELLVRAALESPLRSTTYVVLIVFSLTIAAIYLAIGLLVFLRKPDDRRAFVFNAMSIVLGVGIIASTGMLFDISAGRGIAATSALFISLGIYACVGLAALPITLHLALVFPRERPILEKRPYVIRWVYGLVIAGAVLTMILVGTMQLIDASSSHEIEYALGRGLKISAITIALLGALIALRVAYRGRREGIAYAFLSRPMQTLFAMLAAIGALAIVTSATGVPLVGLAVMLIAIVVLVGFLLAYPIVTCVVLYRSYRDAGVEEKRQVKWPLWGTFFAITAKVICFAISLGASMFVTFDPQWAQKWGGVAEVLNALPRAASVAIPISFAIAIFKYRLMNIDVIIRKTVAYAILSGAILVIYIVLVGGAGTLLISFTGMKSTTMVIASTVVVGLVFVPLRNRLQTLVDRNLFRHRYQYPDALRAISAGAVNAKDAGTLLFMAAEKLQQALQNRSVVFFLRRQDEFVAAEKVGVPDSIVGSLRVPANAVPEPAALQRINSALVVPLRTQSGTHGFISLGAKLSGGAFEAEDLEFLSAAADQLAVAVERIRLQREEADFEQARTMQQSLLPREMPRLAGLEVSGTWQPARAVGGDYYDLLELSATQLAVCIGDVAGKGMPAALLMSGLQAAVRVSASEDVAPRDLCERVRRVVVSSLTGGRFVTFFFCTLDTAAQKLRWCNAGHNAPLLVRADGSIERLTTGGPVFSRVFRDPYAQGETAVASGDRLVLFTDGASEAQSREGEMFGETRLEELIVANRTQSALELERTIVDAVLAFSGAELEDDLTLVVVAVA